MLSKSGFLCPRPVFSVFHLWLSVRLQSDAEHSTSVRIRLARNLRLHCRRQLFSVARVRSVRSHFQRFSIGLTSGEHGRQSKTVTSLSTEVDRAVWIGAFYCWKTKLWPIKIYPSARMAWYPTTFNRPSILCRLPTLLNAIEPQTITLATCLTVCRQHSGANSSPCRRHTYRQPSIPKLISDSSLKRTVFQSSSVHARWTAAHSRRSRRCLGVRRVFLRERRALIPLSSKRRQISDLETARPCCLLEVSLQLARC